MSLWGRKLKQKNNYTKARSDQLRICCNKQLSQSVAEKIENFPIICRDLAPYNSHCDPDQCDPGASTYRGFQSCAYFRPSLGLFRKVGRAVQSMPKPRQVLAHTHTPRHLRTIWERYWPIIVYFYLHLARKKVQHGLYSQFLEKFRQLEGRIFARTIF